MRSSVISVIIVLTASSASFGGGDDYPILVYPCPMVKTSPKVDGLLNDVCWTDAPLVSGFIAYRKPGRLAHPQMSFRIVYDEDSVYFGIRCDEPLVERLIKPTPLQRDSWYLFHHQVLEVLVDPEHSHSMYYQFVTDLAGAIFDAREKQPTWNSHVRVGTHVGKDSWTAEMALPWSDLGVNRPVAGMVVGFNVCRRHLGGGRGMSYWSSGAGFYHPTHFAHLVLSPTGKMLNRMDGEFRKGGRKGPINVFSKVGYSGKTYAARARETLSELDQLVAGLRSASQTEKSEQSRIEIRKRLETIEKEIAPYRDRLGSEQSLDAARWARLEVQLRKIKVRFPALLWDARLVALLAEI